MPKLELSSDCELPKLLPEGKGVVHPIDPNLDKSDSDDNMPDLIPVVKVPEIRYNSAPFGSEEDQKSLKEKVVESVKIREPRSVTDEDVAFKKTKKNNNKSRQAKQYVLGKKIKQEPKDKGYEKVQVKVNKRKGKGEQEVGETGAAAKVIKIGDN